MKKTQEELDELKHEYESLTARLNGLSEDELKQVIGGSLMPQRDGDPIYVGKWYAETKMMQEGSMNLYYYCKADLGNGLYSFIIVIHVTNKFDSLWSAHGEKTSNGRGLFITSVPPEAQKLVV